MAMFRKYISLFWAFARASFAADVEYRVNFGMRILTDIFYYISQIAVFEVLFRQTETLGGWSIGHARIFLGILFVVDAVWMILFSENLDRFSEKVRRGDLDLLLAKPVDSQFIMSFQKIGTAFIGNLMIAVGWLVWSLSVFDGDVPLSRLLWLVVLIPCGVAIMYMNRFMFSVTALVLTRAENLQHLWHQFHKLGTRPDTMYPIWLRYMVLSVLPVAFIASVPARAILDAPDYRLIAGAVVMAFLCILLTKIVWKFALKHYSSASS
ncbi:MAG TPA: ABC-2 family transporter protein [Bdellovibrionales bacterium]|nr:ABC-2 family transporter protein [Bdellovibrionales bacterium]